MKGWTESIIDYLFLKNILLIIYTCTISICVRDEKMEIKEETENTHGAAISAGQLVWPRCWRFITLSLSPRLRQIHPSEEGGPGHPMCARVVVCNARTHHFNSPLLSLSSLTHSV
jgi:hypothetical protein